MRADRLVAVLLLLQRRGQVTAREVAGELEVSERTARRDLEALALAGIPVFSQQGRGGGWRLAGGGRTDLSGLSAGEARALFLVAGPQAATPPVRAALRKLVRALPAPLRDEAESAARAVVVDDAGWMRAGAQERRPPPLLDAVQDAVVRGRRLRLDYVDRRGAATTRVVDPLGLATKGGAWYLVAGTEAGLRTFRVDRVTTLAETGEEVVRPPDFDLAVTWRSVVDEVAERTTPVRAVVLASPGVVGIVRALLGQRVRIGPADAAGHVALEVRGHSSRSLAGELAGFGAELEVLEPPEVRAELRRIGAELAARYRDDRQLR